MYSSVPHYVIICPTIARKQWLYIYLCREQSKNSMDLITRKGFFDVSEPQDKFE